jgi:membrane fusion protein (multidrug efflux system)
VTPADQRHRARGARDRHAAVEQGDVVVVLDDTDASWRSLRPKASSAAPCAACAATWRTTAASRADRARAIEREARRGAAGCRHRRLRARASRSHAPRSAGELRLGLRRRADPARNAFATAKANLIAAQAAAEQSRADRSAAVGSRQANAVLIANATEETNPEVALARSRRDQAKVNLERTVIRAPVDAWSCGARLQVGQQVQAGGSLLSVVPLSQVHVDANFKEVQLDRDQESASRSK